MSARFDPAGWRLYFIPAPGPGWPLEELAAAAIEGGAQVVQLRLKRAGDRRLLVEGSRLSRICRRYGVPFIVNDRADVAVAAGADGVHLGPEDMPVAAARKVVGRRRLIGVSVAGPEEARSAEAEGADYLAVSPVFATPVKKAAPVGLEAVAAAREASGLPLLAIGGINRGNVARVIRAGAGGVAVVSAISRSPDPRREAAALLAAVRAALPEGRTRN